MSPVPKKPVKKDAEFRRKALLYSAIVIFLGLVGGLLLADRIVTAETQNAERAAELQEAADNEDSP